jgi:hypothetical protein
MLPKSIRITKVPLPTELISIRIKSQGVALFLMKIKERYEMLLSGDFNARV